MEIIALIALVFVVFSKAITANRLTKIESARQEEAEITDRLQSTETVLRQLEKEQGGLEQEIKHLENDKDLACLEVTKLGGTPLTEEQLDQLLEAKKAKEEAVQQANHKEDEAKPTEQEDTKEPEQEDPDAAQKDDKAPETERSAKERYRILLVDDNNELRELLQQALEAEYDVLEAPDGYDALTKIIKEKQTYDLVITDLKMPNVDGIKLVEHLPKSIPTIVISAFIDNPEFKEALKKIHPAETLAKPFQMSKLRQAIKNTLPS